MSTLTMSPTARVVAPVNPQVVNSQVLKDSVVKHPVVQHPVAPIVAHIAAPSANLSAARAADRGCNLEADPSNDLRAEGRVTPRPKSLRLTTRGRRVLGSVLVALSVLTIVLLADSSAATKRADQSIETTVVVVEEGQTLWAIAAELSDDGEVRDMVEQIKRLNALETSAIDVGQELNVPTQ